MDEIYKNYSRIVYNYLLSLSNNRDIAEELMQETFYSAIKGINKFREECSMKVWLCQIAKNKWIDYIKKVKKENIASLDDNLENVLLKDSIESLEDELTSREEIMNVYKQIHKLDEKTREVIYLRIRSELTFKEIGNIFEKSEDWARVTFYRGKIKLMEVLKNG
jgi:RNA polymerase sigma-70 factor (ECF subfamily)